MRYYFSRKVQAPFEETVRRTLAALKREGFGVLNEIDLEEDLKRPAAELRKLVILGTYDPPFARQALHAQAGSSTWLPCNVMVQETGAEVEVAAADPIASMGAVDNERLQRVAVQARAMLKRAVEEV